MVKLKNTSRCLQVFLEVFLTEFLWNPSDFIYLLGVVCPYQPSDGKLLGCCYAHWAFWQILWAWSILQGFPEQAVLSISILSSDGTL